MPDDGGIGAATVSRLLAAGHRVVPPRPELTTEQVAESVGWALSQPAGVDVNTVVVRPTGQVH